MLCRWGWVTHVQSMKMELEKLRSHIKRNLFVFFLNSECKACEVISSKWFRKYNRSCTRFSAAATGWCSERALKRGMCNPFERNKENVSQWAQDRGQNLCQACDAQGLLPCLLLRASIHVISPLTTNPHVVHFRHATCVEWKVNEGRKEGNRVYKVCQFIGHKETTHKKCSGFHMCTCEVMFITFKLCNGPVGISWIVYVINRTSCRNNATRHLIQ